MMTLGHGFNYHCYQTRILRKSVLPVRTYSKIDRFSDP
jgi:hypothetical protein